MDFWSDFKEETLSRTLTQSGLVGGNALLDQSDSETEMTVVSEGLLTAQQLEEHQATRLASGIAIGLKQQSGSWSTEKKTELDSVEISNSLYSTLDLWDVLWKGVLETQDSGDLLAWCGREGRVFQRTATLHLPFVEAANEEFLSGLSEPASLGQLIGSNAVRPDHLPARLWILTAAGILELQEVAAPQKQESVIETSSPVSASEPVSVAAAAVPAPPTPSMGAEPRMSRTPLPTEHRGTGNRVEDLRAEHARRMDQDYYAFLGLPPEANATELREVARALAQRMNALSRSRELPEATRQQVRDMLAGVQRVYGTFTDRKRKEDYDAKLREGLAPKIRVRTNTGAPPQPSASSSRDFQLDPEESGGGWGLFRKGGKS